MKAFLTAAAFLVACTLAVRAEEPTGFCDIPFGTPRDSVQRRLIRKFAMKQEFPVEESPYASRDGMHLRSEGQGLVLENYDFEGKKCTAALLFNAPGRFYGFKLTGSRFSSEQIKEGLTGEVAFFMHAFERKYGKSPTSFKFTGQDVLTKKEIQHILRNDAHYAILVGIDQHTERAGGKQFHVAWAAVYDKTVRSAVEPTKPQPGAGSTAKQPAGTEEAPK
jgi:hypothetical protein